MKGTVFQKPLELNLLVDGESWRQGEPITGSLLAKNHGSEPVVLDTVGVHLGHGGLKKVKQKSAGAFERLGSATFAPGTQLAAGEEARLGWSFETSRGSPITDSWASLFLVYGQGEPGKLEKLGQLQLMVHPFPMIEDFLGVFETAFRFVRKGLRWSKGALEVKLAPPESKGFATLEQLVLSIRFEGEEMRVRFLFQLKKMEATASGVEVSKKKAEFSHSYSPIEYRVLSGRFNHERMEAAIGEVMAEVEEKIL